MSIRQKKGFTLIEVLLVIAIIAILAAIVLVAVNPQRQLQQTNNGRRRSDVNAILNSVSQYAVDNRGALPTGITTTPTGMGSGTGLINFCASVVPRYIAAFPFDPTGTGAHYTNCTDFTAGYNISSDANNRVTVAAPTAELGETISVTR